MISTSLLAFSMWFADSGPVFLSSARAEDRDGAFSVEISAESPLSAEAVHASASDDGLSIHIADTRVRGNNRRWDAGDSVIRAHRHTTYTELEVPAAFDHGCAAAPSVRSLAGGAVRVSVACTVTAARAGRKTMSTRPERSRPAKEIVNDDVAALRAAVALASADQDAAEAPALATAKATADARSRAVIAGSNAAEAAVGSTASAGDGKLAPAQPERAAMAQPDKPFAASISAHPGSLWTSVLPPVLLLALGAGGFWLARRRKHVDRMVTILETTSLGPKRSLIIARLGRETLLLGSSEAGIALLKAQPGAGATAPSWSTASPHAGRFDAGYSRDRTNDPMIVDDLTIDEDLENVGDVKDLPNSDEAESGQAHFLARLFGTHKSRQPIPEEWPFDSLVSDSIEDQELRAKLSFGIGAKVP